MSVKGIIGILFIALAIILLLILRWLNGISRKDDGAGDAKSFQMLHEFPEKALVEKEVTKGMEGIPGKLLPDSSTLNSDSYFTNSESDKPTPPPDLF